MPDGAPQIGAAAIDPEIVASRIVRLLAEQRPNAVKPLLAALTKLAPEYKQLALLRAAYWRQMQDIPQALAVLQDAMLRQPEDASLWLQQSEIFFAEGRFAEAAGSAAQAVLLAPMSGAAKSRLGLALMRLEQYDQALLCLADGFASQPANAEVALALAALSPATAIDILRRAIAANPQLAVLHNALVRRLLVDGDGAQAIAAARQAIASAAADAQTHCLLAFAQMQAMSWAEADLSVARAQSMAPHSAWAARLAAALTSRGSGRVFPVAPENALAAEQALIAGGTIAPGAFRALIEGLNISGPVLDVFCGSGLNAVAAQGLGVGPWFGVDPSPALLARCAEQGNYAALAHDDPLQAFAAAPEYAIILLNEALAYWEAPINVLGAIRARLAAGGVALAAIPTGRSGLSGHGLFTHPEAAIAQYAADAGLSFVIARTGILRYSEGLPIHGVIAAFRAIPNSVCDQSQSPELDFRFSSTDY